MSESMAEFEASQRDENIPRDLGFGESLLFPPARPEGAREGLYQTDWWRDAIGRWHRVDEMNLGHVTNVMAFMLHHANVYAMHEVWQLLCWAEGAAKHAADGLKAEANAIERDPEAWLKSTPLYRALKRRRKAIVRALKKAGKSL